VLNYLNSIDTYDLLMTIQLIQIKV